MSSTLQTLATAAPFCAFPSPNPCSPASSSSSSAWDYTAPHPRGGCIRLKCTDGDLWYWWNKLNEKCSTIAAQPDADHIDVPFSKVDVVCILKFLDTMSEIGDVGVGTIWVAEWLGFHSYTTTVYEFMVKHRMEILKSRPSKYLDIACVIRHTNRYNTREMLYYGTHADACTKGGEMRPMQCRMHDIVNAGLDRDYAKQVKLTQEFAVFLKQTNVYPPPDFTRIYNGETAISRGEKRPAVDDITPDAKRLNTLYLDGVTVLEHWARPSSKRIATVLTVRPDCIQVNGDTRCTALKTRSQEHANELVAQLNETPAGYEEIARRMKFTL